MGAVLASFQNLLIMLLVLLVSAFKLDGVVLLDVFDDFGEGFFLDALEVELVMALRRGSIGLYIFEFPLEVLLD